MKTLRFMFFFPYVLMIVSAILILVYLNDGTQEELDEYFDRYNELLDEGSLIHWFIVLYISVFGWAVPIWILYSI